MTILKDDYFVGIWFAVSDSGNVYWLTLIKRGEKGFIGDYCFQYRVNGGFFEDRDTLEAINDSEEEVIEQLHSMFGEEIKPVYTKKAAYIEVKGGLRKFLEIIQREEAMPVKAYKHLEDISHG